MGQGNTRTCPEPSPSFKKYSQTRLLKLNSVPLGAGRGGYPKKLAPLPSLLISSLLPPPFFFLSRRSQHPETVPHSLLSSLPFIFLSIFFFVYDFVLPFSLPHLPLRHSPHLHFKDILHTHIADPHFFSFPIPHAHLISFLPFYLFVYLFILFPKKTHQSLPSPPPSPSFPLSFFHFLNFLLPKFEIV